MATSLSRALKNTVSTKSQGFEVLYVHYFYLLTQLILRKFYIRKTYITEKFSHNLALVREQLENACHQNRRDSSEITLLPVTKNWPIDAVKLCQNAGIDRVGENRVREAIGKIEQIKSVHFDLIGHLQSNKAKLAVGRFNCIQSVDSEKLLEKLAKIAGAKSLVQKILLQVNSGKDPAKFGISIEECEPVLEKALSFDSVDVLGFMTIAPLFENNSTAQYAFEKLRRLRDDMAITFGESFSELSMGMSGDLNGVIAAGSTMIRVGSAFVWSKCRTS